MGDQHPPISRLEIIRLREKGFVQVEEGPIKIMILVPFILRVVYFIVYRRLCKVELRRRKSDRESQLCKTRRVTHLIRGDPHNVTWSVSTWPEQSEEGPKGRHRISYEALRAGQID
jgi:hypothetical protein